MLNLLRTFRNLDTRVKIVMVATGVTNFGIQMTSRYDQIYARFLGANPVDIGILNSLGSFFAAFLSIPLGWIIEKYSAKSVFLLDFIMFFVHLSIFAFAGNWSTLVFAFIFSTKLLRLGALSDVVFVTATEPERRATVISLSRTFWKILMTFAPITAAFLVTYFGGISVQGIRPLYIVQIVSIIPVFLLIAWKLPPTLGSVDRQNKSGSLTSISRDYREALRNEKYLKRWVLLRLTLSFAGQGLFIPFISLWWVTVMGADQYTIGLMGSISLMVALILQIPAGWLADRIGQKKNLFHISTSIVHRHSCVGSGS